MVFELAKFINYIKERARTLQICFLNTQGFCTNGKDVYQKRLNVPTKVFHDDQLKGEFRKI